MLQAERMAERTGLECAESRSGHTGNESHRSELASIIHPLTPLFVFRQVVRRRDLMRKPTRVLGAVIVAIGLLAPVVSGQSAGMTDKAYAGTWKANIAKSKYEP